MRLKICILYSGAVSERPLSVLFYLVYFCDDGHKAETRCMIENECFYNITVAFVFVDLVLITQRDGFSSGKISHRNEHLPTQSRFNLSMTSQHRRDRARGSTCCVSELLAFHVIPCLRHCVMSFVPYGKESGLVSRVPEIRCIY
jgi:hypothetical protein